MQQRIKALLQERMDGEIVLDAEVDPSLIGGFTLSVDDKLLDASVSRQLEEIRRQLMEKNKRIV
jgi:F-type H+-transporting ATPase subunit delta